MALSTDRVNEESLAPVLEVVLDNMVKHKLLCSMEIDGVIGMNVDENIVMSAHELWREVLIHTIIDRVRAEVVKRKLLPISIHILRALLFDVLKSLD
jgi:hypothetical protein